MEENEDKEKEGIDIEFIEQKADTGNDEMLLTLDNQMYKEKTRKTLLRLTWLKAYKSKLMKKFYPKKVTRGLLDDNAFVPNEKEKLRRFILILFLKLKIFI